MVWNCGIWCVPVCDINFGYGQCGMELWDMVCLNVCDINLGYGQCGMELWDMVCLSV